jgi:hypothetical protein
VRRPERPGKPVCPFLTRQPRSDPRAARPVHPTPPPARAAHIQEAPRPLPASCNAKLLLLRCFGVAGLVVCNGPSVGGCHMHWGC